MGDLMADHSANRYLSADQTVDDQTADLSVVHSAAHSHRLPTWQMHRLTAGLP
jgi:hypothetical protein